ncbi:hypothetical protein [Winogradskyella thalassocola]|uniref:DUF4488 domain-containing protein n=1 Tax=Winogradskyella thalassocola TaxID=262004 RepID=A0A1G8I0A8_9FLAO|nr:hypothetical protein [Winogradskyella thalassocola]SDI12359.1 hypothetical protein SAMN04489796_10797 [Winogradskyella thalassocola]
MKYLFTFFIIPVLLLSTTTQKEVFVGKWIGEDQNEIGYLVFDNEGYAAFEINGQVMGGKEFYMKGKKGKMTYSINYDTTPIEVDFTLTKIESGESKKILGIAEFTDKNTLNFNMSFDTDRPTEFGEDTMVLKRVQ